MSWDILFDIAKLGAYRADYNMLLDISRQKKVSPLSPELIAKARKAFNLFGQAAQDIVARQNQDRMLAAWQMLLLDKSLNALDLSTGLFPEFVGKEYVDQTLKLIRDGSAQTQALISQTEADVLLRLNEAIEGMPELSDIVYYSAVINDTNKLLIINDLLSRRIDKANKYGNGIFVLIVLEVFIGALHIATKNNIVLCLSELIINGLILYFLFCCQFRISKEIKVLSIIMEALKKPVSLDRFNLLTAKYGNNHEANIQRLASYKDTLCKFISICRTAHVKNALSTLLLQHDHPMSIPKAITPELTSTLVNTVATPPIAESIICELLEQLDKAQHQATSTIFDAQQDGATATGHAVPCPSCGALVKSGGDVCSRCGGNIKTGEKLKSGDKNRTSIPMPLFYIALFIVLVCGMAVAVWYWHRAESKDSLLTTIDFTAIPYQPFQATALPVKSVNPQQAQALAPGEPPKAPVQGAMAGKENPADKQVLSPSMATPTPDSDRNRLAILPSETIELKALGDEVIQLYRQDRYDKALAVAKKTLYVAETTCGPSHPEVAAALNNLAGLYDTQGQYAKAGSLYQRALAIYEKAPSLEMATVLNNLASRYDKQGQYAAAEPLLKHALAIREKALGPDHPDVDALLKNLAVLYFIQGRYAEAEPLLKRTLAIREKTLGADHSKVAAALNDLASLYIKQGWYTVAEPLLKRALAISASETPGPERPEVVAALNNLAEFYFIQGRYAEAEPLFKRALAVSKTIVPDHPETATALDNFANIYSTQGRRMITESLYKCTLAIQEKTLGPDHPDVAATLANIATLYDKQGRYAEAEPLYKRALAIREKTLGPDHRMVAATLKNLAALYFIQGRYAEAEPLYKRALAIREKTLIPNHPEIAAILENMALLYAKTGNKLKETACKERAAEIRAQAQSGP